MGRRGLLNDISCELRGGCERTGVLAAVRQGASLPPQRSRRLLQLLLQDDFTQVGLDLRGGRCRKRRAESPRLGPFTESHRKNNWSTGRHLVQFLLLKSSEAPQLVVQLSILLLIFIPLTPPPQFTFCRKGEERKGKAGKERQERDQRKGNGDRQFLKGKIKTRERRGDTGKERREIKEKETD